MFAGKLCRLGGIVTRRFGFGVGSGDTFLVTRAFRDRVFAVCMAIIGLGIFSLNFCSPGVQSASAAAWTWLGATEAQWDITSTNWQLPSGNTVATPWDSSHGPADQADIFRSSLSINVSGSVYDFATVFESGVNGVTISGGTINSGTDAASAVQMNANSSGTNTISSALALSSSTVLVNSSTSSTSYLNLTGPITSAGTVGVNAGGSTSASTVVLANANDSFNMLQEIGNHGTILIPSGGSVSANMFVVINYGVNVVNGNLTSQNFYGNYTNTSPGHIFSGSGAIALGNVVLNNGGLTSAGNASFPFTGSLTASGSFIMGITSFPGYSLGSFAGSGATFAQGGGTVQLTGGPDTVGLGYSGNSTYKMQGGYLNIPNTALELGFGNASSSNTSTFNQTGGLANLYGLSMGTTQNNGPQSGSCAISVTGGTLNLGAGGINAGGFGNQYVNFGNATIGATTPWSTSFASPVTMTLNSSTTATFNTAGGNITLANPLGGGGGLTATGGGTLLLSAANTYTGLTTISAGTLALIAPSGSLGTGNLAITPGAVLDTSSYSSPGPTLSGIISAGRTSSPATDINGSVTLQNATISPTTGGTLTIGGDLTFSGTGNVYNYAHGDLVNTTGDVSFNTSSTTSVFPSGGSIAQGNYTLFTYTGADPNASDFQMASSFQSGTRQTYAFSATSGAVTLSVSGAPPANLLWNVAGSGNWDVATSKNWYNTGTSATDFFYNADNVTFNDLPGGGSVSVSVTGAVSPGSITVSNTNVAYTFSGGGAINGSTQLIKSGPGTLTINTANGYTGGTTLGAGLLNLGNSAALGSGALTINGGSLDNTSGGAMTLANNISQSWSSSFTFVGSNPLNTGTGAVTLGTTPTVTVSSGTLTVGGQISGPYGLTLSGSGLLNLGAANVYTGDTTISSGVLQTGTANSIPFGAGAGNLVFSGVQPAVLDLNGINATVNGLSQPSVSSQSKVVNNQPSSQVVLTVGNNGNVTTFGGVLADNTNGLGGTLALTVTGGALTLTNTNTYSGTTTIGNGVTLTLGTGVAGQDGQLTNTNSIVNNNRLVVNNAGPTTLAPINGLSTSLSGALVQNSASTLTLTGQNYLSSLTVNNAGIGGGTINLPNGSSFTNASSIAWTLASAVNFAGAGTITWNGGSGTTDIEAPVTDNTGQLTVVSIAHSTATIVVGNSGSISVNNFPLVLDNLSTGFTTTNLVQTGGLVSVNRPGNYGMYFAMSNGVTFYTMTGGTISATPGTQVTLANGTSTQGHFTINGPSALVSLPSLSFDAGASGQGFVNLENGTLAADNISTMSSGASNGFSGFEFSGGTLQPLDNNAQWGTSSEGFLFLVTGTGATISSNDLSGMGRNVTINANLNDAGAITFTGSGVTTLLGGTPVAAISGYTPHTGATFVTGGGTLQLADPDPTQPGGLGTGPLTISGAAVDLYGMSSTVGALTGNSSALITNSQFSGGTLTVNPSSGGTTTYAGTIADGPFATTGLTLTGSGTLYLTGTNTYSGGTVVTGNTELIVTNKAALLDGSNLTVGNALAFAPVIPSPGAPGAAAPVTPVPEPGTLALVAVGAALLARYRKRRGRWAR